MTWGGLILSTLQHMFSIPGSDIVADNNTKTYIAGMPAVANEALRLVLSVVPTAWHGGEDETADDYIDRTVFAFPEYGDESDGMQVPLIAECAVILPLYMASQLYKEDDRGLATMWRNEFEVALEAVRNSSAARTGIAKVVVL